MEVDLYEKKCISDDFTFFRNATNWACELSAVVQRLRNRCTTSDELRLRPFGQPRNDYAFVDNFEIVRNKAFDVCIGMSKLFWLGSFLKSRHGVGSISCSLCRNEMAAEAAAVLPSLALHQQQPAVYCL